MNEPLAQPNNQELESSYQRKLKNFLLDARFQLKFAAYVVTLTVVVAALLGLFLWRTTDTLFAEASVAVEARSRAAETSKELGNAILGNELLQHMDDPAFEKQLRERSAAIDQAYEKEKEALLEARAQLVQRQKVTLMALVGGLLAFILFIGFGSIVTTHRIVGPLFRMKRMALEVAAGRLSPPPYGLRPGDELRDSFDAFAQMVQVLRDTQEKHLVAVTRALELAQQSGNNPELVRELQTLAADIRTSLD